MHLGGDMLVLWRVSPQDIGTQFPSKIIEKIGAQILCAFIKFIRPGWFQHINVLSESMQP